MKHCIVPKGFLIGIVIAALICGGLQVGIRWCVNNWVKVKKEVACTVTGAGADTVNIVGLNLDCAGKPEHVSNAKVVISYFKNPGPLACTTYKAGDAICKPRK